MHKNILKKNSLLFFKLIYYYYLIFISTKHTYKVFFIINYKLK